MGYTNSWFQDLGTRETVNPTLRLDVFNDIFSFDLAGYATKRNANEAFVAMKLSSMQDQFGLKEYRELGYIPADKVNESVSRTLEYAYDDWCIAQVAKYLGADEDYKTYSARAEYYKNLFDASRSLYGSGSQIDNTYPLLAGVE